MPKLDEGSFLYMPTTMPHASIGEAMDAMKKIDMAMTCTGPDMGNATFTSAGSYTPESYDMDMTIQMEPPGAGDASRLAR